MKILIIGFLTFLGIMGLLAAFWGNSGAIWFSLGGFQFSARMVVAGVLACVLCWNLKD